MAEVTRDTTTVEIYNNTEITRAKNRQFDSMTKLLAQLLASHQSVKKTFTNVQYFKHGLTKTLKLNLGQEYLNFGLPGANYDYAVIQNGDEAPGYYFIVGKRWIAEQTIELNLLMDTLNTFNGKFTLSDKTEILRQHQDGFILQNGYMRRKVDNVIEDFTAPLYKTFESNVNNKGNYDILRREKDKFYLIYVNQYDRANDYATIPLSLYCCFSTAKKVVEYYKSRDHYTGYDNANLIVIDELVDLITGEADARASVTFVGTDNLTYRFGLYYDGVRYHTVGIYDTNNKVYAQKVSYDAEGNLYRAPAIEVYTSGTPNGAAFIFESRTSLLQVAGDYAIKYLNATTSTYLSATTKSQVSQTTSGFDLASHESAIAGIGSLDKTGTRLQKVIELPYNAGNFEFDNDGKLILMDVDFTTGNYDNAEYLKLYSLEKGFEADLYHEDVLDAMKSLFNNTPTWYDDPKIENESKLYNSAFYYKKFVYDSFAYNFELEKADGYSEEKTSFIPTSTINSKFAFLFDWSKRDTKQDYDNVLLVSRNNEVVIYNSQFLDYMRYGYEYDKKLRESQLQLSLASSFMSLGAGAASLAAGVDTTGTTNKEGETKYRELPVAGGIGLIAHAVTSAMNAVSQSILAEQAQAQKMLELQNQKANVMGADDLDLLNAYCGNKAKIVTYEASDNVKNAIWSLFRFYGYKSNKRGNPLDFSADGQNNKRIWFNFVQCNPVFESTQNINSEIEADIVTRLKEGVTVMHYDPDEDYYDLDQRFENWSVWLPGHRDPSPNPLDDIFEDVGTTGSGSGEWQLTPPIYGFGGNVMQAGQSFKYIICMGSTSDPTYYLTAKDGFNNTYLFTPTATGYKVVMTRAMDGREFEKEIATGRLIRLTSVLETTNVPFVTAIADNYQYALEATKNN